MFSIIIGINQYTLFEFNDILMILVKIQIHISF